MQIHRFAKSLSKCEFSLAFALIVALVYRLIAIYFTILLQNVRRPIYSHLFIYNSFLYKNSSSFENTHGDRDVIATLMLADQSEVVDDLQCRVRYNPPQNHLGVEEANLKTEVTTIVDLDDCRLKTIVVLCEIPAELSGHHKKLDSRRIVVGNSRNGRMENGVFQPEFSALTQLIPKVADKTERRLVICMSRIFAFEKWQLIVLAMQVYRKFKVDLVVAHVNSVTEPIFKLLKEYERDYNMAVRSGIIDLPYWPDQMAYDPNTQTEFTGQLMLNHECFYEFRESAEFIALLDWDDLLVSPTFSTLFETFQNAAIHFPKASLYRVNSIPSTLLSQEMNVGDGLDIESFVRGGILSARAYREEKLIVRPSKLLGYWMHSSNHNFDGYVEHPLTTDYAYCLHLAKETLNLEDRLDYNLHLLGSILNLTDFKMAASQRFNRFLMSKILDQLPRNSEQAYYEAILECSRKMRIYYKIETRMQCMAYDLCELPRIDMPCIVAENRYRHRAQHLNGTMNAVVMHQRIAAGFRRQTGCVVA